MEKAVDGKTSCESAKLELQLSLVSFSCLPSLSTSLCVCVLGFLSLSFFLSPFPPKLLSLRPVVLSWFIHSVFKWHCGVVVLAMHFSDLDLFLIGHSVYQERHRAAHLWPQPPELCIYKIRQEFSGVRPSGCDFSLALTSWLSWAFSENVWHLTLFVYLSPICAVPGL